MTRREQLGLGSAGIWAQFFDYERKQWTEVVGGESAPYEEWQSLAKRGGYPAAALLPPSDHVEADRQEIFAGSTQTYLERDLRDLAAIENLYDFQRLMRETDTARPAILYWRTSNGDEVDFVVERHGKLLAIEIKATSTPGYNDTKGLRALLREYPADALGGLLLHGGKDTFWIAEGVLAAPWWKII